jgi:hypothetical protein
MKPAGVVGAALLLAACGAKSGARIDPALKAMVPSDTAALFYVQVEELVKSPLYQKHFRNLPLGPLDEFAQRAGLQKAADLWEVLFLSDGKSAAAIGRGKFANEAEPRLAAGARRTNYKSYNLIGDDTRAVFFLTPTVAAAGDTPLLKRMIDARDESNGPPPALAEKMKQVPYEADVWSVFSGAPPALPEDAAPNLANLARMLRSVDSGVLYLDVNTMITGLVSGTATDEQKGKELHDALRALTGLARMMVPQDRKELQGLLDGVQVTQAGKDVNVRIQAGEEAISALAEALKGQER